MSDAPANPWAYRAQPQRGAENPWARYYPAAEPTPQTGGFESFWQGMLHGAGNPVAGARQLAAGGSEAANRATRERELSFQEQPTTRQHPWATGAGVFAGEMAATAPLAFATGGASIPARIGMGALTGGAGAALAPVTSGDDFASEKAKQVALGLGVGGALGGAGAFLAPPSMEGSTDHIFGKFWNDLVQGIPGALRDRGGGGVVGGGGRVETHPSAPQMAPQGPQPPPLTGPAMPQPPIQGGIATPPPAAPRPAPPIREPQTWTEAARTLSRSGVRLSPGQAVNQSEMERSLQTWPMLRGFVERRVGASLDDFNRAVMAQALEPIGVIVPRSVPGGHGLIEFGTQKLGQAYDRVLPNLSLSRQGLAARLQSDPELSKFASEMASDDVQRLGRIIENRILGRFDESGVIKGDTIKTIERDLSSRADQMAGTQAAELGQGLRRVLGMVRDELANQNPVYAGDLQKINQAFSMFARVRDAAVRDADSGARFSPHDLLQSIKNQESGNSAYARGVAPMQAFAEAGNEVIGPSLKRGMRHEPRSALHMAGDIVGGAAMTPGYLALLGAHRFPELGRGVAGLSPAAGMESARDSRVRRLRGEIVSPPPSP